MITRNEVAAAKTKNQPNPAHDRTIQELQDAFSAACTSTDAKKSLASIELAMQKLSSIDGGSTTNQFRQDIAKINSKMEPDKSLARVLPLMKVVGLDSHSHVQVFDQADGRIENLKVGNDGMLGPAAPLDVGAQHQLFLRADGKLGWRHAIHPQYVEQARLGDCYFLSALQSLAAKKPEVIKNMVHDNGSEPDGSHTYTVRFPGLKNKSFKVDEPTVFETTAFAQDSGGLWTTVIEKAHRQLTHRVLADHGDKIDSATGFSLFTEVAPKAVPIANKKIETLLPVVNDRKKMVITNTFHEDAVVVDNHGNHVQLVGNHAYSLQNFDAKKQTVTVGNPWGENRAEIVVKQDISNMRIPSKFDAVFNSDLAEPKNVVRGGALLTMSLNDFKRHFYSIAIGAVPKK